MRDGIKNAARTVVRESVRSPEKSVRSQPAVRRRGFPLTGKVAVCSTCQLPQKEVMINQQRDNLARLQMFNPLPYRLLPNLMKVQSERAQIVEKSAASKFGYILTRSSKTDRSGRAKIVTTNPKFLLRARELS